MRVRWISCGSEKDQHGTIINWTPSGDVWGPYPEGVVLVRWDDGSIQPVNVHHLTDAPKESLKWLTE